METETQEEELPEPQEFGFNIGLGIAEEDIEKALSLPTPEDFRTALGF